MMSFENINGFSQLVKVYQNSRNRLILLDFDGTLVDFVHDPSQAVPSVELSGLLTKLASIQNNRLVIITGRRKSDIEQKVGHLPIDIVAEHGAVIKENNKWNLLLGTEAGWMDKAYPIFIKYTYQTPHSMLEEKNYSITWHYLNVDPEIGKPTSRLLIESLREIALQFNLKIIDGKNIVEIIDKNINKGLAVNYFINNHTFDFILSMGDDKTDEDMFDVLLNKKEAYTIKVGMGSSMAKYKLDTVQQANQFLEQLLKV